MAITKYGMDAAEIEHLKAANLTDEEINAINKKRVQEQIQDEKEGLEMDDNKPAEGSLGAAVASSGMDSDDDTPILTNAEYFKFESDILRKNGLTEPDIPDDNADKATLDKWAADMQKFVEEKQKLTSDIRRRRQLGAYAVANGTAKGDAYIPQEWTMEMQYTK